MAPPAHAPHSAAPPASAPVPQEVDWGAILGGVVALVILAAVVAGVVGLVMYMQREMARSLAARQAAMKARMDNLVSRFGQEIATKILQRQVWKGQTMEMLMEARGRPAAVDENVMKTKTKKVLKYDMITRGRFRLRVTVEDGQVVGWDHKPG